VLYLYDAQDASLVTSHTPMGQDRPPDRYEPLPGLADLPGWLWRRMGRAGRLAALGALILLVAATAAAVPAMLASQEEQAESDRRERAERRAELVRRLEAEQRPRFRRSSSVSPPGAPRREQLEARATLVAELSAGILADARARARRGELDGPVRRVECERFPRSLDAVGAHEDLSLERGRYACVAVTAEFGSGERGVTGVIGHQYRAMVDFGTGRYAFCKVSGQAGPSREQLVTTPRVCGG
jgi:hypothetical protein